MFEIIFYLKISYINLLNIKNKIDIYILIITKKFIIIKFSILFLFISFIFQSCILLIFRYYR